MIRAGRISRPHGIVGEVKVEGDAELLDTLQRAKRVAVGKARESRQVQHARPHQNAVLLKLKGVNDRNAAEALRGADVFIAEDDLPALPAGQYYPHELLGLRVREASGADLGELIEVIVTGANDVYVVQTPARELLLPAIPSVVLGVDLAGRAMTVAVPDGL